jgi:hypothetical protein
VPPSRASCLAPLLAGLLIRLPRLFRRFLLQLFQAFFRARVLFARRLGELLAFPCGGLAEAGFAPLPSMIVCSSSLNFGSGTASSPVDSSDTRFKSNKLFN